AVAIRLLNAGALLGTSDGDYNVVDALSPDAVAMAEDLADPELLAEAYLPLGWKAVNSSEFEKARHYFEHSVALYVEAHHTWGTGYARYGLGWVDRMLANVDEAERQFELATPDLRKAGDSLMLGWVLGGRAILARYRFDFDQALELHHEALDLFESLGDRRAVSFNLICLGIVHNLIGDNETALDYSLRGVELQREIGWTELLHESLPIAAEIAAMNGDDQLALAYFHEGLDALEESRDLDRLTMALEDLVRIGPDRGEFGAAAILAGKADQLREETGRPMPPPYVPLTESARQAIEDELGDEFEPALTEGASMSFGEALDAARKAADRMWGQSG
ncbi:MAG: tetratricopeptide repeat protein, partial [Acidimicrobiia bacterium]